MNTEALINIIEEWGLKDQTAYQGEAFSRNIGLFTEKEQQRLHEAKVAIPGMGGVGGIHLITLVRCGVGRFNISDFDTFEPANINRQFGASVPNFGRPKLEVMKEFALSINPYVDIKSFPEGISNQNIDDFLEGVDVVLDGLDFFTVDIRRLLFNRAREKGIPVITAGPLGFSAALLVFLPHEGMGFDEYFDIRDDMTEQEKLISFAVGLAPAATHTKHVDFSKVDFKKKTGPSAVVGCQLCGGMAAMEAVRILLKRKGVKPVPFYVQYDAYRQTLKKGQLYRGNRHPKQRLKKLVFKKMLQKKKTEMKTPTVTIPDAEITGDKIPDNIVKFLVETGTWAPSADNCQPWRFSWDGVALLLKKNPERSGFFYDVNQESTFITFGAVMENIRIAATHYGLETLFRMLPFGEDHNIMAEMILRKSNSKEDPLFPFVLKRHVNRKPYKNKPIDPHAIRQLKASVAETEGVNMLWMDQDRVKKTMRKIIFDADRILFEDRRLHEGLYRWLRMDKKVEHSNDGMSMEVLEINWLQKQGLKLMSSWNRLSWLNLIGMSKISGLNSVKLLKTSPVYCLLTVDKRDPSGYIRGGMAMERFWITANSFGISLQPMVGFVFLLNHYYHDGASRFSKKHMGMIQRMNHWMQELLQDEKNKVPFMFFRVGYADPPVSRTLRRSVEDVMKIKVAESIS